MKVLNSNENQPNLLHSTNRKNKKYKNKTKKNKKIKIKKQKLKNNFTLKFRLFVKFVKIFL
jgi:hypothetical protein